MGELMQGYVPSEFVRLKRSDRGRIIQMTAGMLPNADVSVPEASWAEIPYISIRRRGDTGNLPQEARAMSAVTGIPNRLFSYLVVRRPGTDRFRVLPGGHPDMRLEVGKAIAEVGRERFTRLFDGKVSNDGRSILDGDGWNAEYEKWDVLFRGLTERKMHAAGIDLLLALRSTPEGLRLSACDVSEMWDVYTVVPRICQVDPKATKVDIGNTRRISFFLVSKGVGNWPPIKREAEEKGLHYPQLPFCKMLDSHRAADTLRPLVEKAWDRRQAGSQ